MATQAQIAANRLNSLKSTGPSPNGLAKTRLNALKTGIDAESEILPGEDPAELAQLTADYYLHFLPGSPVEQYLVDSIVDADWQRRRYRKMLPIFIQEADAAADPKAEARLIRLYRRMDAAERTYFRSLNEVGRQIVARAEAAIQAAREATVGQALPPANPEMPQAAETEIGFVPLPAAPTPAPQPQPVPAAAPPASPTASKPQKPARWENPAWRL
jgi:hypothetical protein